MLFSVTGYCYIGILREFITFVNRGVVAVLKLKKFLLINFLIFRSKTIFLSSENRNFVPFKKRLNIH